MDKPKEEKFEIGDWVEYVPYLDDTAHGRFKIERHYGKGVYKIGNDDSFVDAVPASMLRRVK